MKKEHKLALLSCVKNKTPEEAALFDGLIRGSVDWELVAGQLYHHRLSGYFLSNLSVEQKKYLFPEFRKTIETLMRAQKLQVLEVARNILPILLDFERDGVRYAALKGLVLNAMVYQPGDRRSNDTDIMVIEDDLDRADSILRSHGFIQSFLPNDEYVEATRKEKLIQRMNYHDTVPYVRRNTENLVDKLEIDINFHFDSKENNVTLEAYELGLEKYKNEHYSVTGLRWDTNLAYMCVHFFREGTNSLWTRNRRDVVLYKIVDVFNVFRAVVNEDNIDAFVRTIKALNLQKACYYTFHYMAQAYEDQAVQYVLTAIEPDNLEFLGEIYHVDKKVTTTRENGYFATAFNLEFCFAKSPVSA